MVLKMEAISGKQQLLALLAKAVETYKKMKGDHIKQTYSYITSQGSNTTLEKRNTLSECEQERAEQVSMRGNS